jgi:hypothetical protein
MNTLYQIIAPCQGRGPIPSVVINKARYVDFSCEFKQLWAEGYPFKTQKLREKKYLTNSLQLSYLTRFTWVYTPNT